METSPDSVYPLLQHEMSFSFEEECHFTFYTGMNPFFLIIVLLQFFACWTTLLLVITFYRKFSQKGCYHPNAKILVYGQMLFTSIFCISFIVALMLHFYDILFNYSNPCSFVKFTGDCAPFYYIQIFSIGAMVVNQVLLSAERLISSLNSKHYESFDYKIGICFLLLVFALSSSLSYFILTPFDPMEMRPLCLGIPHSVTGRSSFYFLFVLVCDLLSFFFFLITWRESKKRNYSTQHYHLGRRYQRRENANVIKMFVPVTVTHFVLYGIYAIATGVLRMYHTEFDHGVYPIIAMGFMTIPYYTMFEMVILNYSLKSFERIRDEFKEQQRKLTVDYQRDAYFEGLNAQWN